MMKTQMMQSVIGQVFRFSGRFICFVSIITSIFSFAQAVSADSPAVKIHEGISSLAAGKTYSSPAAEDYNRHLQAAIVTGQEHIYIADGTSFYGLNERSVNRVTKRKASVSQPQESMAKKEPVRKKATQDKPAANVQFITSLPEGNSVRNISLSGQVACTATGSHHQNFIFLQHTKDVSAKYNNEYNIQNYHYLFYAYLKNIRSGGGIRPPPFRV